MIMLDCLFGEITGQAFLFVCGNITLGVPVDGITDCNGVDIA